MFSHIILSSFFPAILASLNSVDSSNTCFRETNIIHKIQTAGKFVCACAREDARESLTKINKDGGKFFRMLFAFSLAAKEEEW